MTCKQIEWDKFYLLVKASEQTVADFNKIKELEEQERELLNKQNELCEERKKISEKYSQSYTKKLNDRLDDYGILTVLTLNDRVEGHIISVTEETIKVRFTTNYGSYIYEVDISTKELKEKGYVKCQYNFYNNTCYIVDDIKNPLDIFEIIKFYLMKEVRDAEQQLKWGEEDIEKGRTRKATEVIKE